MKIARIDFEIIIFFHNYNSDSVCSPFTNKNSSVVVMTPSSILVGAQKVTALNQHRELSQELRLVADSGLRRLELRRRELVKL